MSEDENTQEKKPVSRTWAMQQAMALHEKFVANIPDKAVRGLVVELVVRACGCTLCNMVDLGPRPFNKPPCVETPGAVVDCLVAARLLASGLPSSGMKEVVTALAWLEEQTAIAPVDSRLDGLELPSKALMDEILERQLRRLREEEEGDSWKEGKPKGDDE
jgi:hypothetical protein